MIETDSVRPTYQPCANWIRVAKKSMTGKTIINESYGSIRRRSLSQALSNSGSFIVRREETRTVSKTNLILLIDDSECMKPYLSEMSDVLVRLIKDNHRSLSRIFFLKFSDAHCLYEAASISATQELKCFRCADNGQRVDKTEEFSFLVLLRATLGSTTSLRQNIIDDVRSLVGSVDRLKKSTNVLLVTNSDIYMNPDNKARLWELQRTYKNNFYLLFASGGDFSEGINGHYIASNDRISCIMPSVLGQVGGFSPNPEPKRE